MHYALTKISRNEKTGPMPVATISKHTCPDACPLKDGGGCYAEAGHVLLHWNKITKGERGTNFEEFLIDVRRLPNAIWRYGQAGDLPGESDVIDKDQLLQLATANRKRPVIAFTHKPPTPENLDALTQAEAMGFHVNLSANSAAHADELAKTGKSVVCILPADAGRQHKGKVFTETLGEYRARLTPADKHTPDGARIAICPATYTDTTCQQCGICADRRPNGVIVGFPAHGTKQRQVSRMTKGDPDVPL